MFSRSVGDVAIAPATATKMIRMSLEMNAISRKRSDLNDWYKLYGRFFIGALS